MNYRAIGYLLSALTLATGLIMLVPAAVAWGCGEVKPLWEFLGISTVTALVGWSGMRICWTARHSPLGLRDAFLLVTAAWLIATAIGAAPFLFPGDFPSFVDAFFESVSGFTTTGASVLTDIEALPYSVLFWRHFIQWLGGMGIIVLAVAVLPQLSVGGIQIISCEMAGPEVDQLKPRIQQTVVTLWKVYILITLLEVTLLCAFGMPLFDSVCHSFATLSTGGFSPKNTSVADYNVPIQVTIAVFMLLGATNFVLHYRVLRHGDWRSLWNDEEWRFYMRMTVICMAVVAIDLTAHHLASTAQALNQSLFQVATVITATGFATADFDKWPELSKGILFLLMFIGGCAGSSTGGLKQVRLLLLLRNVWEKMRRHIFPNSVTSIKLNGRLVPKDILTDINSFFILWMMTFAAGTLLLLAHNVDLVTSASAVISCMSNVGPGLGRVGPVLNYGWMTDSCKLILSACMLLGRLELFTVLVLFVPQTWRR